MSFGLRISFGRLCREQMLREAWEKREMLMKQDDEAAYKRYLESLPPEFIVFLHKEVDRIIRENVVIMNSGKWIGKAEGAVCAALKAIGVDT